MSKSSRFGDFACTVYSHKQVEESCLWLQDNAGVDVVFLLFCCWLGVRGESPPPPRLVDLWRRSRPWYEGLVSPVRQARHWYRNYQGDTLDQHFYDTLKATELAAETQYMAWLEKQVSRISMPTSPQPGVRNAERLVNIYFDIAGIEPGNSGQPYVAGIIGHLNRREW